MGAKKKILDYVVKKKEKIAVPARVYPTTISKAQEAARRLDVPLCDFIEGAILMASEDAIKK